MYGTITAPGGYPHMHRFYIPPEQCVGPQLLLRSHEAHHAAHVLRLRRDEQADVLDGAGTVYRCAVEGFQRGSVTLKVLNQQKAPPPSHSITLVQALPKGKLIESIIQKAAELGVSRIVPLLSERVVVKIHADESAEKRSKWQAVAVEAIKQCGSAWLPKVDSPITPQQFLARREQVELALIGSLRSDARHPREHFRSFQNAHGRNPASLAVWVGPEGDFTSSELDVIQGAGALPISLGPLVLRTETAAVFCLSVLNYELQWQLQQ